MWAWAISGWVAGVGLIAVAFAVLVIEFFKELPAAVGGESGPLGAFLALVFAILGVMAGAAIWLGARLWSLLSRLGEMAISREREFLADATAVAITGDAQALAAALATIGESPSFSHGAGLAGRFCIMSPAVGGSRWDDLLSTHPSPDRRIRELQRLAATSRVIFPENWSGVGDFVWVLPAGSLGLVLMLAALAPACV
jgi:Zn-dependent protease with chaperone function